MIFSVCFATIIEHGLKYSYTHVCAQGIENVLKKDRCFVADVCLFLFFKIGLAK